MTVVLPPAESPLLTRELLYTAITRAEEHVRIIGTEEALVAAVRRPIVRASGLGRRTQMFEGSTQANARLATTCFDILRVLDGVASADMYHDPPGRLTLRLEGLHNREPSLSTLASFIPILQLGVVSRNDLQHALAVQNGLYRRTSKGTPYVREFFTVEAVADVTAQLSTTDRIGNQVLHADGGAAVQAWYAAGGS